MHSNARAANKEERRFMAAIAEFGCIACFLDGIAGTPAAVHHILSGGIRVGHHCTLPLCDPGHHQPDSRTGKLSVHYNRRAFVARYGTELELWEKIKQLINWQPAAQST